MKVAADYKDVKTDYPQLPVGFVNVLIEDVELQVKGERTDFVVNVVGVDGDANGVKAKDFIAETASMSWKFLALMKSAGWPEGTDFDTRSPEDTSFLLNKVVRVKVIEETYDGKKRRKIQSYYNAQTDTASTDDLDKKQNSSKSSKKEVVDDDFNF